MKKLIIKILCLSIMSITLSAQSSKNLINKADSLYESEKYKASGETFDDAFVIKSGNAKLYYNAACSWALSGRKDKAFQYLDSAANKGLRNKKWLVKDKDLQSLHQTEQWKKIVKKIRDNLKEYQEGLNITLKNKLEQIYIKDQTLRQLLGCAREKFGENSQQMKYLWSLISRQDSLNETITVNILEEHGWVGKSKVGGKANMALWLVIQHAPIKTQEKYVPLLKRSVKEGESSGRHLALLVDRILMRKGKPQIYGSQVTKNSKTGGYELYKIKNPEKVNKRRKEIGLAPMEKYLKQFGINWETEKKQQ